MRERAVVVGVTGDRVRVVFRRTSVCHECGICADRDGRDCSVQLKNSIGAGLGDAVLVIGGVSDLAAASVLYGLPSIAFVAGLIGGLLIFHSEMFGVLAGVFLLLGCVMGYRWIEKRHPPRIEKGE